MAPRFYRDDEGRLPPAHLRHRHRDPRRHVRRASGRSDMLTEHGPRLRDGHAARARLRRPTSASASPSSTRRLGEGRARAARVQHRAHGVSRAVLYPDVHARGRHVLPATSRPRSASVYNDWILDRVLRRLGRTADPRRGAADDRRRRRGRRGPALRRAGLPGGVHPHQPGERQEVLRPELRSGCGRRSSRPG